MRALFAAVLLATISTLPLGTAQSAEWTVTSKVVAIADGDTLTVLDDAKRQHKIRLAGIDAPEKRQVFGQRSRRRAFAEQRIIPLPTASGVSLSVSAFSGKVYEKAIAAGRADLVS